MPSCIATLLYCERGAFGPGRAATHAEAAAFGFLQQHGTDHHGDDHEVNDDNDGLHLETFRHKPRAPGFGCTTGLRVFLKLRGVTRSDRALSPPTPKPRPQARE